MAVQRDWLIKYRSSKELTQQQVADLSNIERPFYTQIETGVRSPSVKTAKKIAKALRFDWTIFYNDNCSDMRQKSCK